jgi:hypothetical protein
VPQAFADHVRGRGIEFDDDFVVAFAFHDHEGVAEVFVEIEIGALFEFLADGGRAGDAAENDGAEIGARVCLECPRN